MTMIMFKAFSKYIYKKIIEISLSLEKLFLLHSRIMQKIKNEQKKSGFVCVWKVRESSYSSVNVNNIDDIENVLCRAKACICRKVR